MHPVEWFVSCHLCFGVASGEVTYQLRALPTLGGPMRGICSDCWELVERLMPALVLDTTQPVVAASYAPYMV